MNDLMEQRLPQPRGVRKRKEVIAMLYKKPEVCLIHPAMALIQGSPIGSKNDTMIDSAPSHVTAAAYEADE
jgi:hypothetical protein